MAEVHPEQISSGSGMDATVMTRVLLRARWIDKMFQGMFLGWKVAYEQQRGTERQLEFIIKSLDGARRSAYNDRQLLVEFRNQSHRLQE
jgi:hypothetical protein